MAAATKTLTTTIVRDGSLCFIPVPFDSAPVFGKVRAPVTVTIGTHTYRSTIASMGSGPCIPLRRSNREAIGLDGRETVKVTVALDTAKREVSAPADLVRALEASKQIGAWTALSYSHQKEHVDAIEGAKQPATRARRIAKAVEMVSGLSARKRAVPPRRGPR